MLLDTQPLRGVLPLKRQNAGHEWYKLKNSVPQEYLLKVWKKQCADINSSPQADGWPGLRFFTGWGVGVGSVNLQDQPGNHTKGEISGRRRLLGCSPISYFYFPT